MSPVRREHKTLKAALLAGLGLAVPALGQSASLTRPHYYSPPGTPIYRPVTVDQISLTKLPAPPQYQLHDLVHIEVNETIINRIQAQLNKRRNNSYTFGLDDWVLILDGLRLRADQTIRSETPSIVIRELMNEQKQYQFNRNDILRYDMEAEIVEIRPNGTLVLEAFSETSVNNEVYQIRFSGIVSPADIDPSDRSIDSTYVTSKQLDLRVVGPARDTLKRGFITAFIEWFNPF